MRLFLALAPRLPRVEVPEPPRRFEPWSTAWIERPGRRGRLVGTWYPAEGKARGAVLLLPPWLEWGRAYFHRRQRIQSLRSAGYQALAVDFPGFGGSGPVDGFFDRDVADALADLGRRAPDLPLYVWGVSAGGYWSHMLLSHDPAERTGGRGVEAAVFEDVSPHLLEWAGRLQPWTRPCHWLFRTLFPASHRFFDVRLHAAALPAHVQRVAYVGGAEDPGIPVEDARKLARRAGEKAMIVPDAGHLESIKRSTREVIDLALATFDAGS